MEAYQMRWEYFLFNLLIVAGPIIGGFFYKKRSLPSWSAMLMVVLAVAFPFWIWDHLVTDIFWSFNQKYILGLTLGNLPLEEVLFFLTVPSACLFLWVNIKKMIKGEVGLKLFDILMGLLLLWALYWIENFAWYSVIVFLILPVGYYGLRNNDLLKQKSFWVMMILALFLTGIFNGYLTARPVVTYESKYKSNINIGTVPLEDFAYGLILVGANVALYEKWNKRRN